MYSNECHQFIVFKHKVGFYIYLPLNSARNLVQYCIVDLTCEFSTLASGAWLFLLTISMCVFTLGAHEIQSATAAFGVQVLQAVRIWRWSLLLLLTFRLNCHNKILLVLRNNILNLIENSCFLGLLFTRLLLRSEWFLFDFKYRKFRGFLIIAIVCREMLWKHLILSVRCK